MSSGGLAHALLLPAAPGLYNQSKQRERGALADNEHLKILLKKGVGAWNAWRPENPDTRPDLTRASLTHANLKGANLTHAILTNANLTDANLTGADLTGADLTDANNLTQEQLDAACIKKDAKPPTLPEGLKPPQKVCGP